MQILKLNWLHISLIRLACQTRDPSCKREAKKLEEIQNRCPRLIFNTKDAVSFSNLSEDTGIPSLQERRKERRHRQSFAKYNLIPSRLEAPCHSYKTKEAPGLYIPSIKSFTYFNFFFPKTIRELCKIGSFGLLVCWKTVQFSGCLHFYFVFFFCIVTWVLSPYCPIEEFWRDYWVVLYFHYLLRHNQSYNND